MAAHPDQAFKIVAGEFSIVSIFIVYLIGITATVWHLANGIWLFLVDWGITIGDRGLREGNVEYQSRRDGVSHVVARDLACTYLQERLRTSV